MQDLEDKFYIDNFKILQFEDETSVQGCVDAYENLNNAKESIVKSLINKMRDYQKLTPKAYKIIFENINYEASPDEALEFVKEIMSLEKQGKLPQLDKFNPNAIIIKNLYAKAMDYYVKSDLSEHLNDEFYLSIPDCNCTCLINFLLDMKLQDGENQEWLHNKVEYWRTEIANQFSSILYNTYTYHFEGISKNIFLHWCNLILTYFSKNDEVALRIKKELEKS